ncbi:MAG: right-handed parallel beta-helix repeat-containing protein [Kiritimatiellales bacterium]
MKMIQQAKYIAVLISLSVRIYCIETDDPVKTLTSLPAGTPAEITIAPGTYKLPAGGFSFKKLQDVKINAAGVIFIATEPRKQALRLEACTNVTIDGLTIDYDPLPFTQGTITSIDAAAYTADFTVHDGYPDLTKDYLVKRFHLFAADQPRWKEGAPEYYIKRVESLSARTGRIYLQAIPAEFAFLEVGDRVVFNLRSSHTVNIMDGCKDITLENFTIHAGPGAAIIIRFAENAGTYKRVRVIPGPLPAGATEERLFSTCADGFNVAYTRAGPILEDSEFAYMGDDSVNLHGVALPVMKWENSRACLTMRPFIDSFNEILRPGDEVRFLAEPDYRLVATAEIKEMSKVAMPDASWMKRIKEIWPTKSDEKATFYRVRFDRDVKFPADGLYFEVFAISAPDYIIRNCWFHDHRGRGLRLMTGNGLVESNRFERIKDAGISAGHSLGFWKEAGWVENVIIRNNIIKDTGMGARVLTEKSYTLGAISIFAENKPLGKDTPYYPGNRNLQIIGNTIEGYPLDGIHIAAAKDVLVEGNTIRRVNLKTVPDAGRLYGVSSGGPVTVQFSESVTVTNNIVVQ